MTNHLGNVLAVITDRKRGQAASGTAIQWYEADVMATQQYYPFGMLMPTSTDSSLRRQYSLNEYDYRYGFNGKEGDDEIKGDDNQQDYGMRIYDPRVGRFLSVDPLAHKYSSWSPYNYVLGNPINLIDPTGMSVETDYYSLKGKKLGSDGINNGEKRLVLTDETSKEIKKKMKKTGKFSDEVLYDDIIKVHTYQELIELDDVYTRTETGNPHEEGFLAGSNSTGNLVITKFPPGPDVTAQSPKGGSLNPTDIANTEQSHISSGANIDYIVHSHPWYSFETPTTIRIGGTPAPSGKVGSDGDLNHQHHLESTYKTKYGIILGYPTNGGKRLINFYRSTGPITTLSFDKYKSVTRKILSQ